MADNIAILDGAGASKEIATKDISSVHYHKHILYDINGDPLNVEGGDLAIKVQDQHTDILDYRLHLDGATITLAATVTIDTYICDLVAGHGVTAGMLIVLREGTRYYEGIVLSVATDRLTMDTPFDFAFTASSTAYRTTYNMNLDGSSAVKIFHIKPLAGTVWDITRILFYIQDNAIMDDSLFGGIAALTRGVVLRKKNTTYSNIFNVKSNGEFALRAYDAFYTTKAPAEEYGFRVKRSFAGQEKNGVTIRLDGDNKDELQLIVQDDLTALKYFYAVAQGHIVE